MAEAADDRVELLDAILVFAEPGDPRADISRSEQERIKGLKLKYELPRLPRSSTQIAALAREVGIEQDYKCLFKILNKLVHPTAYFVNYSVGVMDDDQMRDVLLTRFQLYALDLIKRATDELGVPSALTVCRHCTGVRGNSPDPPLQIQ